MSKYHIGDPAQVPGPGAWAPGFVPRAVAWVFGFFPSLVFRVFLHFPPDFFGGKRAKTRSSIPSRFSSAKPRFLGPPGVPPGSRCGCDFGREMPFVAVRVYPKMGPPSDPPETDLFPGRSFPKRLPEAEENAHATFVRFSSRLTGSFVRKVPKPMFVLLLIFHANDAKMMTAQRKNPASNVSSEGARRPHPPQNTISERRRAHL